MVAPHCQKYFSIYWSLFVHLKNRFRWFLYLVVTIVLLKLCYNLGNRLINGRTPPATTLPPGNTDAYRQAQGLRGVEIDPADSAEAAADTARRVR